MISRGKDVVGILQLAMSQMQEELTIPE